MKIDDNFLAQMREATRLLQTSGPMAATAAIQQALHGAAMPDTGMPNGDSTDIPSQPVNLVDINPPSAGHVAPEAGSGQEMLDRLRNLAHGKWKGSSARQPIEDVEVNIAGNGKFLSGSVTNQAGTRAYKLYVPSAYTGQPLPLVVMLHGCKQNPDDFAVGTGMNDAAEETGCFVVYPAQAQRANGSNCWNWFQAGDQRRDQGEPSIIADITRAIMREYKIDASRIYVAGLSAGGAMAAIMAAAYPELYAAVGIHSGLPYGVAHDLPSALAAMKRSHGKKAPFARPGKAPASLGHAIPVIVFHGDRDTTVHPSNGDEVLMQCMAPASGSAADKREDAGIKTEKAQVPGGRMYTRTLRHDANGKVIAEQWIVHGAGHAWSGGSSKGSYTDPKGPPAAREMLRFFRSQVRDAK